MEMIAKVNRITINIPLIVTKYSPINPPRIKKIIPAKYIDFEFIRFSGITPVPPLNFVLFVLVSIPLLKSE